MQRKENNHGLFSVKGKGGLCDIQRREATVTDLGEMGLVRETESRGVLRREQQGKGHLGIMKKESKDFAQAMRTLTQECLDSHSSAHQHTARAMSQNR